MKMKVLAPQFYDLPLVTVFIDNWSEFAERPIVSSHGFNFFARWVYADQYALVSFSSFVNQRVVVLPFLPKLNFAATGQSRVFFAKF